MTVSLHDSTRVRGIYRGSKRLSDESYRLVYDAWRAEYPRGASYPEIGEVIEIDPGGKGPFRAFVAGGVEIWTRRKGAVIVGGHGMMIRPDGTRLDLLDARDLAIAGKLPMASTLRIDTEAGEQQIALDRIAVIDATNKKGKALAGFIVGLAIDVIIVAGMRRDRSRGIECENFQGTGFPFFTRSNGALNGNARSSAPEPPARAEARAR